MAFQRSYKVVIRRDIPEIYVFIRWRRYEVFIVGRKSKGIGREYRVIYYLNRFFKVFFLDLIFIPLIVVVVVIVTSDNFTVLKGPDVDEMFIFA